MDIIPDSSFFICFLDDLEGLLPIDDRVRILSQITSNFRVIILPEVNHESRFERIASLIKAQVKWVKIPASDTQNNPSIELLRPLLGKGEHQVITYAYGCLVKGNSRFIFILDDGLARNLVKRILPTLISHMKGTVGFIGHCAIHKVLEKKEAIDVITNIGDSKFRVDRATITTVITEVRNRCA